MGADNSATARRSRDAKSAARHAEIVQLLRQGLTINQVMEGLSVSRKTVHTARSNAGMVSSHVREIRASASERYERILELDRQGMTADVIADRLKIQPRTVERARSKAGLTQPTRFGTEDEKLRAKQMLADGVSYEDVGMTLGRDAGTIARWHPGYAWTMQQRGERSGMARKMNRLERSIKRHTAVKV